METVPLMTLSSCLKIDPLSLLQTSTGHKPAIFINRRNNTITFHHQPSLFPSGHLQLMCGHRSRHVVKAVGMHGGDEEYVRKNKARGVAGGTLVFACVVGAMCFTRPMCRPALAIWPFWFAKQEVRESSSKPLMSTLEFFLKKDDRKKNDEKARVAQERLNDMLNQIADKDFYNKKPPPVELSDLKETARKFACNTDRGKAKPVLDNLAAKYKDLLTTGYDPRVEALGKILVEMKIFLGTQTEAEEALKKFMEAANLSEDKLKDDPKRSSADLKLYKAEINLMSNNNKDARDWWEKYKPSVEEDPVISNPTDLIKQYEDKLKK